MEYVRPEYDEFEKWLKKASDDDLKCLEERARGLIDWTLAEPVVAVEWSYVVLIGSERESRGDALAAMEAELNGGHRVVIGLGDGFFGDGQDTYAAFCDPRPGDEDPVLCWRGPDRTTLDEAIDDGRLHLPGVEPVVLRCVT